MATRVLGPALARVEHVREGSVVGCPEGQEGVLEVWASEKKYPGKHFAVFFYEPDAVLPNALSSEFVTSRYFRTSCLSLCVDGDSVVLSSDEPCGCISYAFVVLGRTLPT